MKNLTIQARKYYKRFFQIRKHQSAGPNASPARLVRNALPYLFFKNGYSFSPLSIFFIINGVCQFKCKMCDIGQKNPSSMFHKNLIGSHPSDFPIGRWKTLIDEVKRFKPYISITSTEPLLYKPLPEAIEHTVRACLKTNILTNGYVLEQRAEELMDAGLYSLNVSIDGPSKIHNNIRGVDDAFERAIKGINRVIELKKKRRSKLPHIGINSTIIDINAPYLVDMVRSLPVEEIDKITYMTMVFLPKDLADKHNKAFGDKYFSTETCLTGGARPDKVDIEVLFDQLVQVKKMYPNKCHYYFQMDKRTMHRYFYEPHEFLDDTRCIFPWFAAQITAKGDLVGLTRCFATPFGNILNNSFSEVWLGDRMRDFRKDLQKYGRFPACTRCEGTLYE